MCSWQKYQQLLCFAYGKCKFTVGLVLHNCRNDFVLAVLNWILLNGVNLNQQPSLSNNECYWNVFFW